jgi:hypothetical protein
MRLVDGRYECALCGAKLDIPGEDEPRVMIKAGGGTQPVRVLMMDGVEIHSCVVTTPRAPEVRKPGK